MNCNNRIARSINCSRQAFRKYNLEEESKKGNTQQPLKYRKDKLWLPLELELRISINVDQMADKLSSNIFFLVF